MDEKEFLRRLKNGDDDAFGQIDPETLRKQNQLSGRINAGQFDNWLNELENEVGDDVISWVGKTINVYKFRKVSGITSFSTNGQGDASINPNEKGQFLQIYNSTEPLTIVWENSTKINGLGGTNISKELKVGTYYQMYYAQNDMTSDLEDSDINIFGVDYKTQLARRTLSLKSKTWEVTLNDQMNFLYIIIDPTAQMPQLLELKTYSNAYHHNEKRKFLYSVVTFESVNFKFSQSGRNVLEAIQFSAPGEEYAYPKEIYLPQLKAYRVILDEDKLFKIPGANTIQLDFNNAVGLSDIRIIGRRRNVYDDINSTIDNDNPQNNIYRFNVDIPARLLLSSTEAPIPNIFTYNIPNASNVFTNFAKLEKTSIWDTYRDAWRNNSTAGDYNILEQKEVRAGIKHPQGAIQNKDGTSHLWEAGLSIDMRQFFNDQTGELRQNLSSMVGVNKTIARPNAQLKFHDWINLNGFYNANVTALNYSQREVVKFSLKDVFGAFGGIIQTLMGGLDWGWTKVKTLNELFKSFNFTQPLAAIEDTEAILGAGNSIYNKVQPLDFFDDEKSRNVLPVNNNLYCAFRFGLTNMVKINDRRTNLIDGKGGNNIWRTLYIGQTKFEDATAIPGGKLLLDLSNFEATPSSDDTEFIVDMVEFKALASCDYKLSAFRQLLTETNAKEIYGYYGKTTAKVKQDLRLWTNRIKLNYYDEINSFGNVDYPLTDELEPAPILQKTIKFTYNDEPLFTRWQSRMFNFDISELLKQQNWPKSQIGTKIALKMNGLYLDEPNGLAPWNYMWIADNPQMNNKTKVAKQFFVNKFQSTATTIEPTAHQGKILNLEHYLWVEQLLQQPGPGIKFRLVSEYFCYLTNPDGSGKHTLNGRATLSLGTKELGTKTFTLSDNRITNPVKIRIKLRDKQELEYDISNLSNGQSSQWEQVMYSKTINSTIEPAFKGNKQTLMSYKMKDIEVSRQINYRIRVTRRTTNEFIVAIIPVLSGLIILDNATGTNKISELDYTPWPKLDISVNQWDPITNSWEMPDPANESKYSTTDTLSPTFLYNTNYHCGSDKFWLLEYISIENKI